MNRPLLLVALSTVIFAGTVRSEDTTIYRTKNADGTYSYSQTASEGAEARIVHSSGASTKVEPAPTAAAPIAESIDARDGAAREVAAREACETATANLAVFDSGQPVGREAADGSAVPLSAEEVAAARADATRRVAAYCGDTSGD
jgi:hypothetical protein